MTIKSSVGKGGKNDFEDTQTVQALLNAFIMVGRLKEPGNAPLPMLLMNGKAGSKTIGAIEVFQRLYMSEIRTCKLGLVEPHGDTIVRLNGSFDPPKGSWYAGACPSLPSEKGMDDEAGDPWPIYSYDQGLYRTDGFCLAASAKWTRLRSAGKDFLASSGHAEPPGSDILHAQDSLRMDGSEFDVGKDLPEVLGRFHMRKAGLEFSWHQGLNAEEPGGQPILRVSSESTGLPTVHYAINSGAYAAHLAVRHWGLFLHLMWAVTGEGHAVAYHVENSKKTARFRIFDPNTGHLMCHSGKNFVQMVDDVFHSRRYNSGFDAKHVLVRVKPM